MGRRNLESRPFSTTLSIEMPLLFALLPWLAIGEKAVHFDAPIQDPIALEEEPAEESTPWTGSASVGATLTQGNSNTVSLAATFDAERTDDEKRWTYGAWWNFTEQTVQDSAPPFSKNTDITARNWGTKLQYDRFLDESSYWYVNGSTESDEIALLQVRAKGGVGGGYQFHDDERWSLKGEAGGSFVHEDLEFEPPNEYSAVRLAYSAGYTLSESTTFSQSAEFLPSLEETDDWTGTLDTTMNVNMTPTLVLRLQHVLDYDNTPAKGGPGAADDAGKSDHRVMLTLGWNF